MIRLSAFADEAAATLDGQIAAMKRNGISYLEVRGINNKNVADFTEDEAKCHADRLSAENIRVWAIGSPLGKVSINCDFDEYRKKVAHICRIARIFGTRNIRIFSFFEAYSSPETVSSYLREMVKTADEYGVKLYHENEKAIYGDTVERVLSIRDSVEGLGFVYDPANYLEVGEDPSVSLDALHALTDYFHIKDVIRSTGQLVPAGHGDGNIRELIARIGKDEDKVLTVEPHLAIFSGYAEIDGTEMKNKYQFATNDDAFDAAVRALKDLLAEQGYTEIEGGFVKL